MRSTKGFIAPTRDDIQKISKTENGPEASEQSEKDSLALSTDSEYYSDDFESDTDERLPQYIVPCVLPYTSAQAPCALSNLLHIHDLYQEIKKNTQTTDADLEKAFTQRDWVKNLRSVEKITELSNKLVTYFERVQLSCRYQSKYRFQRQLKDVVKKMEPLSSQPTGFTPTVKPQML